MSFLFRTLRIARTTPLITPFPLASKPTHQTRRHASWLRTHIRTRLADPDFMPELWRQYRRLMIYMLLLNGSLAGGQLLLHAWEQRRIELENPTPESWPQMARYYLRLSRERNPYFYFGDDKGIDKTLEFLDWCIEELEKIPGGAKDGIAEVRKERGRVLEKMGFWDQAEKEYEIAMNAGGKGASFASNRLAKIREWKGDVDGAEEALMVALKEADKENMVDAMFELGVFKARHGRIAEGLQMVTEVLAMRRALEKEVIDPKRWTPSPGDPCKIAATEAVVGELLFALGKKEEGVQWSESAFENGWKMADFRTKCRDCALVTADNLIKMGEILEKDAEKMKKGWFSGDKKKKELLAEAQRLKTEYDDRKFELEAIKVVRDAEFEKNMEN
ncbi:hypothetical protein BZA77DRAFT_322969 [Pyronema omphalodes]|nr:hypothetical protein BZA77DRAFT_322969 [Pyronema omphalodes]